MFTFSFQFKIEPNSEISKSFVKPDFYVPLSNIHAPHQGLVLGALARPEGSVNKSHLPDPLTPTLRGN